MNFSIKHNFSLYFFMFSVLNLMIYSQTETNLNLLTPNGGEYWTTGSSPRFTWKSSNVIVIKIEISYDAGANWTVISPAAIATSGSYVKWVVPSQIQSDSCLVRISKYDDAGITDLSKSLFRITTDTSTHTLVVLGSSTAAGIGPSTSDSAWVSRYRNYLFEKNTTMKVNNLAVGGYTTYDIMPTGFIPPPNRPTPKIGRNISKAVTYVPEAIIINLPSNDVNLGYSINEQLSNYDTILSVASDNNIPVWVTTTQPRNFSSGQILKQIEMRDSTFVRFGEKAIDFWTTIADTGGSIDPLYDSGDGIHLNDKAHAILSSRVVDAKVFDPTVVKVEEKLFTVIQFELLQNYPNPFNPSTKIKYSIPTPPSSSPLAKGRNEVGFVSLKVYDILGREVATLVNGEQTSEDYEVTFNAANLASGVYIYTLIASDFIASKKMLVLK